MSDILVFNGNIIWEGDEIYIAGGNEAIEQEAYLRATCDKGESIFYSEYGSIIFKYFGKPYSETNKALIESEAKEILLQTDGIEEVLEINLKYVVIDDNVFPCIFAKYRYQGTDKIVESKFQFKV